jgi:lipooligosaccharide transport system permease protein
VMTVSTTPRRSPDTRSGNALAHRLARALPLPAGAGLARTLVERNARAFRHGWITLVSGFFEPVFYLFALGVGLGTLVGDVPLPDGSAVPYAAFVAPALLASSAMNGAVYDSTFNIFFKLKYARLYDSVLATPLGPRDVAVGEISWALLRGLVYSVAFFVVALLAGVVSSWWALLALPAASLIGFAFAAVGMACTTFMRSWVDFDYVQLAILPMFLFSATFYPLSTYPESLQWVVQATPLFHGVQLVRDLMLGQLGAGMLWHVGYLVAMGLVGVVIASRRLEKLLLS